MRNIEDLLDECGTDISHETVRYLWNKFGPTFAAERPQSLPLKGIDNLTSYDWVGFNRSQYPRGFDYIAPLPRRSIAKLAKCISLNQMTLVIEVAVDRRIN